MHLKMSKDEKKKLMEQLERQGEEADVMLEILEDCKNGKCHKKKEGDHAA